MHCFLPSIPALPASRAVFWCVLNSSGTHDPAQNSGLSVPEYNTAENLTHPPESMIKIPMRKGYTTAKLRNVFFAYGLSYPGLMPGTGLARAANSLSDWL
ncbi:hypothetical protein sscle_12g087370 [Sclerotinia sclerotiorum 1980 UF-70]|uniref:Uncharacterized protein n=1 Tax=Sclerotinia sclerotiorum (strain ATCC 18683 / 1980 / Ss-1) TaxID=665079 RepID=A0A1D9QGA4_SCLS1|nr:hypothetical protein sscle_12g087370 [Sclerotinia sclerotiorum 1980 UF-70]